MAYSSRRWPRGLSRSLCYSCIHLISTTEEVASAWSTGVEGFSTVSLPEDEEVVSQSGLWSGFFAHKNVKTRTSALEGRRLYVLRRSELLRIQRK